MDLGARRGNRHRGGTAAADRRRSRRRGQGDRRLPILDRHDAAGRDGTSRGRFRLDREPCGPRQRWLAHEALHADLCDRDRGDDRALERRDGGRAHTSRRRVGSSGEGQAVALSLRLRAHRERRELRAPNLQPDESRRLRARHSAARKMDQCVRAAVAVLDCAHVRRALLSLPTGSRRRRRGRGGSEATRARGPNHALRDRADRRRAR